MGERGQVRVRRNTQSELQVVLFSEMQCLPEGEPRPRPSLESPRERRAGQIAEDGLVWIILKVVLVAWYLALG